MPTYEYACSKCDEHFDVFQPFSEEPLKRHRGCGGKLSKVLGSVGIVLKGSGFYKTDSRSGSSKPSAGREASGSGNGSSSDTESTSSGSTSDGDTKDTESSGGSSSEKSSDKQKPSSSSPGSS